MDDEGPDLLPLLPEKGETFAAFSERTRRALTEGVPGGVRSVTPLQALRIEIGDTVVSVAETADGGICVFDAERPTGARVRGLR